MRYHEQDKDAINGSYDGYDCIGLDKRIVRKLIMRGTMGKMV